MGLCNKMWEVVKQREGVGGSRRGGGGGCGAHGTYLKHRKRKKATSSANMEMT